MKLAEMTPSRLQEAPEEEVRSAWLRLSQWYGAAQAKGKAVENIVNAAVFVSAEFQRRGWEIDPSKPLAQAVASLQLHKGMSLSVAQALDSLPAEVLLVKDFACLVGSAVSKEKPRDIDVLLRARRDGAGENFLIQGDNVYLPLRKALDPEKLQKLHFIDNPQGPHSDHVPLYSLVLRRESLEKQIVKALQPGDRFPPQKPHMAGYTEFFSTSVLWPWCEKKIKEGAKLAGEVKFDGFRCIVSLQDGKVSAWFEDSGEDRASHLPGIAKAVQNSGYKSLILDGEMLAVDHHGRIIPRTQLLEMLSGDPAFEPYYVAFDCLNQDEDISQRPLGERQAILEAVVDDLKSSQIQLSKVRRFDSQKELEIVGRWAASQPTSEGLVVKDLLKPYHPGGSDDWCLPPETPIFAYGDVVPVSEVTQGRQLGPNNRVEAVEVSHAKELISFNVACIPPVRATPNHRFEVVRDYRSRRKKLSYRNYHYRNYNPTSERKRTARVHEQELYPTEWVEASDIKPGDGLVVRVPGECKDGAQVPGWVKADPELFYLLGWYVAEGYCYGGQVRINLGKGGSEVVDRLGVIAKKYWNSVNVYHYEKEHRLYISRGRDKDLDRVDEIFLEAFGEDSYQKHLPRWMWSMNDSCLQEFLRGYWDGDGGIDYHGPNRPCTFEAGTASQKLAWQLWFLLARLGVIASLGKYGRVPMWHIAPYTVPWVSRDSSKTTWVKHKDFFILPVKSIKAEPFDGPVYHIQTTSEQFLCPVVSHNSKLKTVLELKVQVLEVQEKKNGISYLCGLRDPPKIADRTQLRSGLLMLGNTFVTQLRSQPGQVLNVRAEELLILNKGKGEVRIAWGKPTVVGPDSSRDAYTVGQAVDLARRGHVLKVEVGKEDVPAWGREGSQIAFVAASPNEGERSRREPMVGPPGELFQSLYLEPAGLKKEDVALLYLVPQILYEKGQPRAPGELEVEAWTPHLMQKLSEINPRVIVALGKQAGLALEDLADFVMPHPAAVHRYGNSGEVSRKIKQLMAKIQEVAKQDDGQDTRSDIAAREYERIWWQMVPASGKGRFVLQAHWRGLSEEETKLSHEDLLKTDHSVHCDLRLEIDKSRLWGFTIFEGSTKDIREKGQGEARILHLPPTDSLQGAFKLQQPHAWLTIAEEKPFVSGPGGVGSTSQKFSKFFQLDAGTYEFSFARQHGREVFLHGEKIKGRLMLQYMPASEGRVGVISRPESQEPYTSSHKFEDVIEELKEKGQEKLVWATEPGLPSKVLNIQECPFKKQRYAAILKADEEKRLVFGVISEPDTGDLQGDVLSREEIARMARNFEQYVREFRDRHTRRKVKAEIVRSWIAEKDFWFKGELVKAGSWLMCVRVLDDEIWGKIKSGIYRAFSIGGRGVRIERVRPDNQRAAG